MGTFDELQGIVQDDFQSIEEVIDWVFEKISREKLYSINFVANIIPEIEELLGNHDIFYSDKLLKKLLTERMHVEARVERENLSD